MAAGKRYSAGRIFLQVIPAFGDLQDAIKREVGKANRTAEAEAEKSGERAGQRRSKAEGKARVSEAKKTEKAISDVEKSEEDKRNRDRLAGARRTARGTVIITRSRVKDQINANAELESEHKKSVERMGLREQKNARGTRKITRESIKDRINAAAAAAQAEIDANAAAEKARAETQKVADAARRKAVEDELAEMDRVAQARAARRREELDAEVRAAEERAEAEGRANRQILENELADLDKAEKVREQYENVAAKRRQKKNRAIAAERLEGIRQRDALQGGALGQTIRSSARGAANALPDQKIDVDSTEAERKIAGIRAKLLQLSDAKIGVDISAAGAIQTLAFLRKELNKLERDDADIDVNANVAGALLALKAVERQIDQIQRKKLRGMFMGMFAGLKPSAEDGANSFRIFNMRVLGLLLLLPLLAPALASAGAALGALAVAGTAAAAGIGITLLAFSGIKDAVSAMSDVADNAQKDTLARVKAIRNASRGIRDAEQGVARARSQAARAAEDNARRITDAEASVVRARRDAGRSAEDSARRIADAERRLAEAQENAADSQDRLREARKRAQQDQLDLADQIKRGILDERQALIDLFNAQVDYNAVMASGGSTNLEKEQADINLERAQLAIKEIRDTNREMAAENTKAAAAGVEGSAAVVGAKEDEADAQRAIADAERGVADARRDARDAAVAASEDIAAAERGVIDARRESAQSAADNAIAVRDANERLADAQTAYSEAVNDTSESVDKLRTAMDKLSPAQRRFALFLYSMRGGIQRLKEVAAGNILPGLQEAMEGVAKRYGPGFFAFVDKMSVVAGKLFVSLGEALQSPVMAEFFKTMDKYGPTLFKLFGEIGINVMKIFGGLMTAFAPFSEDFMTALERMTASWAKWAEDLKDNPAFMKFIEDVKRDGPKLLKLIGLIGSVIWTVLKGLAEGGMLDKITSFFQFLKDLDPKIITGIVGALVGLLIATQVAAGITSLFIAFKIMTMTLTGTVVLALFVIVGALVLLYQNSETFRKVWDAVWGWVKKTAKDFSEWFMRDALPVITGALTRIGEELSWLWTNIFKPVFSMIWDIVKVVFKAFAWYWENILWPVFKAIFKVVWELWTNIFWPVLKLILEFFAAQIRGIKWVWDNVLKPVFTAIGDALYGPMKTAWTSFSKMVGDVWDDVVGLARDGVNGVIGMLNELSKAFNSMMEAIGSPLRISMIGDVQWGLSKNNGGRATSSGGGYSNKGGQQMYTGGWTGPGAKYDEVGTVHADEYVIKKESTNKIRSKFGLAFLDHMNETGEVPGYADGGLVAFGKRLQMMGYQVGEHPAFGRVGRHGKGSLHYSGKAIDVNYDGQGQAKENAMLDALVPMASGAGFGMKWRVKDHFGHMHIDKGGSTQLGGGLASKVKGAVAGVVNGGLEFLQDAIEPLMKKMPGKGPFAMGMKAIPGKAIDGLQAKIDEILGVDADSEGRNYGNLGGVDRWRPTVMQALSRVGQPSSHANSTLRRMMQESGGNQYAINNWDSNAKKGTPSKGLMQVIDPTFRQYRDRSLSGDIYNPMANIVASMNYAMSRYGSLPKAYDRKGGYAEGGLVGGHRDNGAQLFDSGGYLQPGWTQVLNATGKPEPVFTAEQFAAGQGGGGTRGPLVNIESMPVQGPDVTPGSVASEIMWAVERASHGGKFAGVSN